MKWPSLSLIIQVLLSNSLCYECSRVNFLLARVSMMCFMSSFYFSLVCVFIFKVCKAYFILLHFVVLPFTDTAFFSKWNVCGNSAFSKYIGTIFSTAFNHFVSLYHMSAILPIFQTFSLLLYLLWWSVISDIQYWYCNFCFSFLN